MKRMFSVVMPAYNAATTIQESIQSVINQSFKDFELIIVDDGSTDNTKNVIDEFCDDRISYYKIPNSGVSVARNYGMDKGNSDFICFLDSDDIWFEDHLNTLYGLIKKYVNAFAFSTGYQILNFDGQVDNISMRAYRLINNNQLLVNDYFQFVREVGTFIHINSFCISHSLLEKIKGFQSGERIGEDTDFIYRAAAYSNIAISTNVTTEYRRNETSTTAKRVFNYNWCFLENSKKILNDPLVSPKIKRSIMCIIESHKISKARNYLLSGNRNEAKNILRSIDRNYCSIKRIIVTWIMSFVPKKMLEVGASVRDRGEYKK